MFLFFNAFYCWIYCLLCMLLVSSNTALSSCWIKRNCACWAWCVCGNCLSCTSSSCFFIFSYSCCRWNFLSDFSEKYDKEILWEQRPSTFLGSLCITFFTFFFWQNVSIEVCLISLYHFLFSTFFTEVFLLRSESASSNLCMRSIKAPSSSF